MNQTNPHKTLIVGPSWIGDMVMANSLFRYLKHRTPDLQIDVLAPDWSRPILERMPEVSKVIEQPLKHGELKLRSRYRLGKQLRQEQYQQAITLPRTFKSALIPYWANIPQRTGWLGEYRYGILNDIRQFDEKRLPLMVHRYLGLALENEEKVPEVKQWYPRLVVDRNQQQVLIQKFELTLDKPVAAFCPGAAYGPSKRWPAHYFAELANQLIEKGWQVWLFGAPADKEAADTISKLSNNRCLDLIGKTSLAESIDLLSLAHVVVANDSGTTHIAAALDKRVIAIYGATPPQFAPPLCEKGRAVSRNLPCCPCFKRECPFGHYRCLFEIKPEQITQEIAQLFP